MPDSDEEETSNNKLLIEAMRSLIETKLNTFRQEFQSATDQERNRPQQERNTRRDCEQLEQRGDEATDDYYGHISSSSQNSQRRHNRRAREGINLQQDNLGGFKLKIPPFHGKNDLDAYLEWEKKIELVFNVQNCTEVNRVRVAATEFYDYALSLWDQYVTSRRRNK